MVVYGYGKILNVDLSAGKIVKKDIDPEFAREFIGGMGFGCKILFDQVGTDVDPFSPDNVVIFAIGALTGTHAPCSSRTEITTKSPLTGSIGTGNTGGTWGAPTCDRLRLVWLRNVESATNSVAITGPTHDNAHMYTFGACYERRLKNRVDRRHVESDARLHQD